MTYAPKANSIRQAERRTSGRYGSRHDHGDVRQPANGVAKPVRSKNVLPVLAVAVVPDPLESGRRLYARVNRFVDVLEVERSHRRISEAAYQIGRELQAVFEVNRGVGSGSQWREGDRVDAQLANECAVHRGLDAGRRADAEMKRLTREVGELGAAFLRTILSGTTFATYAAQTTSSSRADVAAVAAWFRTMLEEIVRARQARGAPNRRAADKYDEQPTLPQTCSDT